MHSLKLATEEDWPEVLRMARAFHSVSPYNHIPFSETKVRSIFDLYQTDPTKLIIIVGLLDMKVVGVIVGMLTDIYFSDTKTAGEIIWWVDEEARKTRIGKKLFDAFEYWGWKIGAKFFTSCNTSGAHDISRYLNKNGYHMAEQTFIKEIKDARI